MNELQLNTIDSYNKSAYKFTETIGKLINYNHTYDALLEKIHNGEFILDLACGPGQICKYMNNKKTIKITGVDLSETMLEIAQKEIPSGKFYKHSIIDFKDNAKYHAVIIGFGIPYLDKSQTEQCIENALNCLLNDQYIYISFMHGDDCRLEKTSFGGNNDFIIYYHKTNDIKNILEKNNVKIIIEFELDYYEKDNSVSKDIVLIGQKRSFK